MINKKYLKEYIKITEDWLFYNKNVELIDNVLISYKEDDDRVKVSLGTIDTVTGQTGGAVLFVKYYPDYSLIVRRLKINKLLKRC